MTSTARLRAQAHRIEDVGKFSVPVGHAYPYSGPHTLPYPPPYPHGGVCIPSHTLGVGYAYPSIPLGGVCIPLGLGTHTLSYPRTPVSIPFHTLAPRLAYPSTRGMHTLYKSSAGNRILYHIDTHTLLHTLFLPSSLKPGEKIIRPSLPARARTRPRTRRRSRAAACERRRRHERRSRGRRRRAREKLDMLGVSERLGNHWRPRRGRGRAGRRARSRRAIQRARALMRDGCCVEPARGRGETLPGVAYHEHMLGLGSAYFERRLGSFCAPVSAASVRGVRMHCFFACTTKEYCN
jgi:hypothetical protein